MKVSYLILMLALLALPLQAAAANAKDVEAAFAQGQTAYKEGRLDEAAESFTKAADALVARKEQDKARAVFGNVAVIRMKQERWQDAYDVYARALELPGKPDPAFHVKAVGNMAFCAEKAQRHDLKAEVIEKLLSSKTKVEQADLLNFLSMQGDARRAAERYALASQSYEKALALKDIPQDKRITILTGLGLAQSNLGRYSKALESLSAALKDATALGQQLAMVEATSNIGVIYWEMGQYEKAAATLQTALDHAKKFALRRNEGVDSNNMGLVYKSAGKLNDAVKQIDAALAIAREVNNLRDEAIALSNRALLFRMSGDNKAARESYAQALEMYRKAAFTEGEASALMGLAKMDLVVDKDHGAALEKLNKAAAIYEELENPGFLAEACVQLGQVYQKIATPHRKTRDLVFEDEEPGGVSLAPAEALAKSREWYARARPLAEETGRKEMIWSALHGLGFVEREGGNLQAAMDYYSQAVAVVLSMKGTEENSDLLLEFLRDKDSLFAEAIEVCTRLYERTKDPALLQKQMEYDEIYRNEVVRANMKMASLSYAEPEKKALYDEILQLTSSKKKTEAAARKAAKADQNEATKSESLILDKEASVVAKVFEEKLALWKDRYPQDAVLFDSFAAVDTVKLQSMLGPKQAIIQYLPLDESLIIMTITKESVEMTGVAVSYKDLAVLIRDHMLAGNIEAMTRIDLSKPGDREKEHKLYAEGIHIFEEVNRYLYQPIEDKLKEKDMLYLITSKFLSYVPFPALITGRKSDGSPEYLIESKTLSLNRLSFLAGLKLSEADKPMTSVDIIAVGNPIHNVLNQKELDGAEGEARNAIEAMLKIDPSAKTTLLVKDSATETAWYEAVKSHAYSVMYFATHGVPLAETLSSMNTLESREKSGKLGNRLRATLAFLHENFQSKSHIYAYLYMAYPDQDHNGVLTLKKIFELPESIFSKANLAVMSACNSAVTYSPKVLHDKATQEILESEEAAAALVAAGWTPGMDQVCLVDTFMKRNFRNVYGNFWAADDTASAHIMKLFTANLQKMAPPAALREAQMQYLKNPPAEVDYTQYPKHPTYWACGNIFGQ